MIGVIINVIETRKKNIPKIISIFKKNKNFLVLFICQFPSNKITDVINKNLYKNIFFIDSKIFNLSHSKNIGIDFFNKKKEVKYIWFLDDDCYVNNNSLNGIFNKTFNSNFDLHILQIFNESKKRVGRNLNYLNFFSFFSKYLVGGPSIIVKKSKILNKFDKNFGYGGEVINGEDTKFLIDNNFKKINVLPKELFVTHPAEYSSFDRIKKYSFGQGFLYKKIKNIDFIFFSILILYRPILGIILNCFLLDLDKIKIHYNRIKYFLKGINQSIEKENTIY